MVFSIITTSEKLKNILSKEEKIKLLIFIVIVASLTLGTVLYMVCNEYFSNEVSSVFSDYLSYITEATMFEAFSSIIIGNMVYFALTVIFGSSSLGIFFVLLLTFFKVAGLSIINAYLYSDFGLKGIEYSFLVFFPGKFILLLAVLMLTSFCVKNSLSVKRVLKGEHHAEKSGNVYFLRISVIGLLLILSAIVECFLIRVFSDLFIF